MVDLQRKLFKQIVRDVKRGQMLEVEVETKCERK